MPTNGQGHCTGGGCTGGGGGGGFPDGTKWIRYFPGGTVGSGNYVLIPILTQLDRAGNETPHWDGRYNNGDILEFDLVRIDNYATGDTCFGAMNVRVSTGGSGSGEGGSPEFPRDFIPPKFDPSKLPKPPIPPRPPVSES